MFGNLFRRTQRRRLEDHLRWAEDRLEHHSQEMDDHYRSYRNLAANNQLDMAILTGVAMIGDGAAIVCYKIDKEVTDLELEMLYFYNRHKNGYAAMIPGSIQFLVPFQDLQSVPEKEHDILMLKVPITESDVGKHLKSGYKKVRAVNFIIDSMTVLFEQVGSRIDFRVISKEYFKSCIDAFGETIELPINYEQILKTLSTFKADQRRRIFEDLIVDLIILCITAIVDGTELADSFLLLSKHSM